MVHIYKQFRETLISGHAKQQYYTYANCQFERWVESMLVGPWYGMLNGTLVSKLSSYVGLSIPDVATYEESGCWCWLDISIHRVFWLFIGCIRWVRRPDELTLASI